MLRIILWVGNIGLLISSFSLAMDYKVDTVHMVCYVSFMFLSVINIFFIKSIYSGSISLSIKRRKLEEEIKIQEAENKLKELKK